MTILNEKEDLRIRRTIFLLKRAVESLLQENSLESISVSDICNKAMVQRATFYKHFSDKYDLCNAILIDLKQEIIEKRLGEIRRKRGDLRGRYRTFAEGQKNVRGREKRGQTRRHRLRGSRTLFCHDPAESAFANRQDAPAGGSEPPADGDGIPF